MHWSKSVHINFSVAKSVPDFSFSPWMQMWSITVKKWNTSRRKSAMTFSKVWFHFKTNLESWVKGVRKQVDSQACSRFNIRVHTYYNRKATGDQVFQLFLFYTCWAMWLNRSSLTDLRDPEIQNCKLFKFPFITGDGFGCRVETQKPSSVVLLCLKYLWENGAISLAVREFRGLAVVGVLVEVVRDWWNRRFSVLLNAVQSAGCSRPVTWHREKCGWACWSISVFLLFLYWPEQLCENACTDPQTESASEKCAVSAEIFNFN